MEDKRDIISLLKWAREHGEAKIIDRILIKLMPDFLHYNCPITAEELNTQEYFNVPASLYEKIQKSAEEIVGTSYTKQGDN